MASASAALGATGSGGGIGDVGEGVGALPLRVERFSDGRRVKNEAIAAATGSDGDHVSPRSDRRCPFQLNAGQS